MESEYQRWVRENEPRMYWGENGSIMVRADLCRQYVIGGAVFIGIELAALIFVLL